MLDIRVAIQVHLSTNFYPPFPSKFIDDITEPLVLAMADNMDDELEGGMAMIELPADLNPYPRGTKFEDGKAFIMSGILVNATKAWRILDLMEA